MTRTTLSAPEIPLCVNVLRMLSYQLAPDELIFFDWLVVKQIAFGYKPFYYSQTRIEQETRIRRTRQESIIEDFVYRGFLTTEVKVNAITRGRVRYFSVDFKTLSDPETLAEIINPEALLYNEFQKYMEYHAKLQKKSKKEELSGSSKIDYEAANHAYDLLNCTYEARIRFFNSGEMTGSVPKRLKQAVQLQRNKPIDRKLAKLGQYYNDANLKSAFISYVDSILKGENTPDNLMYYFLSFDEVLGAFGVIDHHLNNYALHYSYSS